MDLFIGPSVFINYNLIENGANQRPTKIISKDVSISIMPKPSPQSHPLHSVPKISPIRIASTFTTTPKNPPTSNTITIQITTSQLITTLSSRSAMHRSATFTHTHYNCSLEMYTHAW